MKKMIVNILTFILILIAVLPAYTGAAASTIPEQESSTVKGAPNAPAYTLAQTLSDGAQRTTLAFSGLAIMTGNLDSQSFFPPGKVADYTGFQYLRDNDPDNMGHNTSFLTRVANNVIYILNVNQFNQLKTLAVSQQDKINQYGYGRFALMKAARRLLEGDIPSGSTGLDLDAVKEASRELYLLDGQISFDRALLYANVLNSLDPTQKAYLAAMKGKGWSSWPNITDDQIKSKMAGLPQGTAVAVMTYAGDLFSWYAGSVDADVYFCPERHGTYYGSFYIKDAPAIGHEGYSIDEQLTATAGSALCDSSKGYVTPEQAAVISSLVNTQRNNIYASATSSIVQLRTQIATLLRTLLISTASSDAIKGQVLALSSTYGDLDGENNYNYATIFAQVYKTLTSDQKTKLADLRQSIMSGTYSDGTPFDFTICTTPFLYSSEITEQDIAPYIADTDYLFSTGTVTSLTYPIIDTGQTKCYNSSVEITAPGSYQSFYGQDAQFPGTQPSYIMSNDGKTVIDNVTGLTWMRGPNTTLTTPISTDKKTFTAAQSWVATVNAMNYGGYSDWRLPTIKELYSLMNFNGTDPSGYSGTDTSVLTPFIDTAYFKFGYGQTSTGERIIDSQYASSTIFIVNPAETGYPKVFGLNLADGRIKGYDLIMPGGSEKTFFVQLVRGSVTYGINSFTDNGDGTVSDASTGLMWSQGDSVTGMTWQAALAWVQTKNAANYLGHNDWRLPNAKELHSLVNYANAPDYNGLPTIDTTYFTCTGIVNENGTADFPYYWTSTTHATYNGMGSSAVYIAFGRALGWPSSSWVDVHGAGCQRSDPKVGPPYAYATTHMVSRSETTYTGYAFGPQGDALRGLNFVRLVRDGSDIIVPPENPTVTNASGASSITTTTAILNGNLTSTGGSDTTVIIYGGTSDGGTSSVRWDFVENLGTRTVGEFSLGITGLTSGRRYYYRCYAANFEGGAAWATETSSFVTKSTWAAYWEGPGKDWRWFSSGRP